MKKVQLLLLLIIPFCTLKGQNLIKVGPTALANINFNYPYAYLGPGLEVAYEIPVFKRNTIIFGLMANLGRVTRNWNDEFTYKQTDFHWGGYTEFRYFTEERYKGMFGGLGVEIKELHAYNYFRPSPDDPFPHLYSLDLAGVLTIGYFWPLPKERKLSLSTSISVGNSEYPVANRISLMIGL